MEIGLTLVRKDFVPNGYHVDEEKYLRTIAKTAGRKEKALASSLQQDTEVVEEKEEKNVAQEENHIDLNNNKIGALGGSEPPLSGVHLTSLDVEREVLLHKRNVMTPETLFSDNAFVDRVELPPPGSTIETRQAKKAKQSCPTSGVEAFSSFVTNDSVLVKLIALEERV